MKRGERGKQARLERYYELRRSGMTKLEAWIEMDITAPSTQYSYEHWWQMQPDAVPEPRRGRTLGSSWLSQGSTWRLGGALRRKEEDE